MPELAARLFRERHVAVHPASLSRGDIVILDNLSSHKSPKPATILKQRGAWFLFLPP